MFVLVPAHRYDRFYGLGGRYRFGCKLFGAREFRSLETTIRLFVGRNRSLHVSMSTRDLDSKNDEFDGNNVGKGFVIDTLLRYYCSSVGAWRNKEINKANLDHIMYGMCEL